MIIKPGARLPLDIEKPAAGGRMLARHAGQVVLVAGTIPGERVVARVERVGKGVAFAEAEEIVTASPDRRAGAIDWRCGGNAFAHVVYPRQLTLKAQIIQDAFGRIGRLPLAAMPDVLGSPEQGYRMRARLHVQGDRIGFYREGTHQLCDAAATGQLLPSTVDWIERIAEELRRLSIAGTDHPAAAKAQAGRADARSTRGAGHGSPITGIEVAENIAGDQRGAFLEAASGVDPAAYEAMDLGPSSITDTIRVSDSATLLLRRDVRAFFQGNRFLLEPLVQRVMGLVESDQVVDLYAGVGLFGLSLAAAGAREVTLVEGDPISGADLQRNAAPYADRVHVHRQSVEDFLAAEGRGARLRRGLGEAGFIVDPPRTGLTREALAGIIRHGPSRLVYVSCDVATLARDARTLVDAGWELTEVTGIDLFPNTAHVESIAVFVRG
jgi:23S rRNA (uracil1939-C5)-methyltransferase